MKMCCVTFLIRFALMMHFASFFPNFILLHAEEIPKIRSVVTSATSQLQLFPILALIGQCDPLKGLRQHLIEINANEQLSSSSEIVLVLPEVNHQKCSRSWRNLRIKQTQLFLAILIVFCASKFEQQINQYNEERVLTVIICPENQTMQIIETMDKFQSNPQYFSLIILTPMPHFVGKKMNHLKHISKILVVEQQTRNLFKISQLFRPLLRRDWLRTRTKVLDVQNPDQNPFSMSYFSEPTLSNLRQQPLRVTAVMDSVYAFDTNITEENDGSFKFNPSFALEILRVLELTLNFRTIPKVTRAWGHLVNQTNWEGMIALLLNDTADFAISSTADSSFRRQVVHFNFPTNEIHLTLFFRKPSCTAITNPLTRPFRTELWAVLIVWIFIAGISIMVMKLIINGSSDVEILWNHTDCFHWSLSTVCFMSYYNLPHQISMRILMTTALFASVVINCAYGGTLISFLFVHQEPITNLGQLLETNFEFSIIDDPIPLKVLSDSQNPDDWELYARRKQEPKFKSMSEVVEKLNKGSFVFVVDNMNGHESLAQDFTYEDACLMRSVRISHTDQKEGSMVPKNSSIKRIIDYQILRMHEFGFIRRWTRTYLHRKVVCVPSQNFDGVKLESVRAALLSLFGVIILSIFILACEFEQKRHASHQLNAIIETIN